MEEVRQPAAMIVMAVAYDQRVHRDWVDFQIFEVVGIRARRVTEIQKVSARLVGLLRFQVQRETPFAV